MRPVLKGEPHFLLCSLIFFEAYLSLFCGSYCLLHLNVYSIIQHCQHCSGLKKKSKQQQQKSLGVEFVFVQEERDPYLNDYTVVCSIT